MTKFVIVLLVLCAVCAAADRMWGPAARVALSLASAVAVAPFLGADVSGNDLRMDGRVLSVGPSCTSIEFVAIFLCAVLAWPAPWRRKLVAIPAGLVILFVAQEARVILMAFLSGRAFHVAHTLSGAGFVAVLLALWLAWTHWSGSSIRWSFRNPAAAAFLVAAVLAGVADLALAQGPPPPPPPPTGQGVPLGGAAWALGSLASGALWTACNKSKRLFCRACDCRDGL